MDFLMTSFGPYFQKSQSWIDISPPNIYVKEFLKWETFHMDFNN
jgi:hypothetical protein